MTYLRSTGSLLIVSTLERIIAATCPWNIQGTALTHLVCGTVTFLLRQFVQFGTRKSPRNWIARYSVRC